MTGCEFATLPDPCAAFFTWQDHLHAGEYLWIDIRKKVAKSVQCGETNWTKVAGSNPSGLCFCLAVDRNPDVTEKLNQ